MTASRLKHLIIAVALAIPAMAAASSWAPDILGDGYVSRRVDQGKSFDGPVASTIIAKPVAGADTAALYIHGFNDYFFQAPLGDEFTRHGYSFFAVDLRRYGRSLLPGQRRCDVRSIDEYFPDIDSAIVAIARTGARHVILMGHSTGGLIATCYVDRMRPPMVDALVLNSPFLDWNLGKKEWLIPLITWWGRIFPSTDIPQPDDDAYARSLLSRYHGRWTYNTAWKSPFSPDVTAGWIRAITLAQRSLREGEERHPIRIPILVFRSTRSITGDGWTPEFNSADCVLDVADIDRYSRMLGTDVTIVAVPGALHDVILSSPPVADAVYGYLFNWLTQKFEPSADVS